jgi:hypothetical protein
MILDGLLNTETARLIQFAKISNLALSRPAGGAIRFHQDPIVVRFAVFLAAYSSQEHA